MPTKMIRAICGLFLLTAAGCSYDAEGPSGTTTDGAPSDAIVTPWPTDAGGEVVPDSLPPDTIPGKPRLIILHTNDLHEHLMGWSPNADYTPQTAGDDQTVGGLARLATAIKAERAAAAGAEVLVLDGGDFSMGTLFTWLGPTQAPTLSLMDQMGYDAVVIGNHELEWGLESLAARLNTAASAGVKVNILSSNMAFSSADHRDDGLEQLHAVGVIKRMLILTLKNGLKVGLFGLMGKSAADVALDKDPVTFDDQVDTAKQIVNELKNVSKVDLVICLSHSGSEPSGKGEDVTLAKAVPGIDVIISGHTHDRLEQPIQVGGTRIVQTGNYGAALGRMELTFDQAKTLGLVTYRLIDLDDAIPGDPGVQQTIEDQIVAIDAMLQPDLAFKKVVAETAFDLTEPPFQETTLGDLIADSYRMTVNALQPAEPADLAIASSGHIRDEVLAGKTGAIWFADLYRALPLGIGPDKKAGYPLVTYYLTGNEIETWMEILYLAEKVVKSNTMFFQVSGIQVEYDNSGLVVPLFSVDSIKLTSTPGAPEIKDTSACFKVVSTISIAGELERAGSYSLGFLEIKPKLADCKTEITDLKTRIVDADPQQPGLQELKAWLALTRYVRGFPDSDGDGIPEIPASYAAPEGRIIAK